MTERNATHGIHLIGCTYIREEDALDRKVDVSYIYGFKPVVYLPKKWTKVLNECKVESSPPRGENPSPTPLLLIPGTEIRLVSLGSAQEYAKIEVRACEEE